MQLKVSYGPMRWYNRRIKLKFVNDFIHLFKTLHCIHIVPLQGARQNEVALNFFVNILQRLTWPKKCEKTPFNGNHFFS